jgi:zinc transporter 2
MAYQQLEENDLSEEKVESTFTIVEKTEVGHDHGHDHDKGGHDHSHDHRADSATVSPLHDHGHGHRGHSHSHDHHIEGDLHDKETAEHIARKPLYVAMGLCFLFMLIELAGGLIGHSLAIITDALHMLTDVFSFALAIYASIIANQASTSRYTYGFKRAEVLSALVSTLLIWVLTAVLMYEAFKRIVQYQQGKMDDVNGGMMFFIAIIGVGFNLVLERVLGDSGHGHSHGGHSHGHVSHDKHHDEPKKINRETELLKHGHDHSHGDHDHLESGYGSATSSIDDHIPPPPARNLNIDAAYLHVIGDLIQSIGVAIAGILIWYNPTWKIVDPICTIIFGIIVMITTLSMLWSNVTVLLEGVPDELDIDHIEAQFMRIKGKDGQKWVTDVHDLHIWSMSAGAHILTAHVAHSPATTSQEVLGKIHKVCVKNGIAHATIQVLPEGAPCTSGICCV